MRGPGIVRAKTKESPVNHPFRTLLFLVAVSTSILLPGAGIAADKIKVVATFTVIADMVTNVAGDLVDLVTIVGPDADCEEYEPTPEFRT
jgi:zinc/manganese transport system substrate-binding protein